ncbi:hypothetical protein [Serratia grimesii]|jgi:hypothetical protein|uniref:hypothetical protein n=1 Tax=Serratia grimesii TaxID=82995 RepID=UPI00217C8E97|nr:hypothetical protein [Serratia grimesii]CAI1135421.1 Uncharacterised protein [Serratia grimesii]CAI2784960.1 Uncharacterised protein [Serratia grimesii]
MLPTVAEYARQLADELGLANPLPHRAARAALYDPRFRRFLYRAQNAPNLLRDLIEHAPPIDARYGNQPDEPEAHSTTQLAQHLTSSILAWSKQGFKTLDETQRLSRLAACQACPHLGAPPDRLDYRIARIGVEDQSVCTLCGCFVERKTKLPHERCPAQSDTNPALNRWGDAYQRID